MIIGSQARQHIKYRTAYPVPVFPLETAASAVDMSVCLPDQHHSGLERLFHHMLLPTENHLPNFCSPKYHLKYQPSFKVVDLLCFAGYSHANIFYGG